MESNGQKLRLHSDQTENSVKPLIQEITPQTEETSQTKSVSSNKSQSLLNTEEPE